MIATAELTTLIVEMSVYSAVLGSHEMRKPSIYLTVALVAFVFAGSIALVWLFNRSPKQPQVIIPDAAWPAIFFEKKGLASKSINEITSESNLSNLRGISLRGTDLEVRVWVGLGLNGTDGFVLRRSSDRWSALSLHGMAERPPFPQIKKILDVPKSGWETAWQRLVNEGILTLPDATSLQCDPGGLDGTTYIVEINMNGSYRTYMYHDPDYAKCDEAKRMTHIGRIIAEEFGLNAFRVK